MTELKWFIQDINQSSMLEQAKGVVQLFTRLHCSNEEVLDEFLIQQTTASKLLDSDSEDQLLEVWEVYQAVIQIIEYPDAGTVQLDTFKQITKSIGFATRYALEQGWLSLQVDDPLIAMVELAVPADSTFAKLTEGLSEIDDPILGIEAEAEGAAAYEAILDGMKAEPLVKYSNDFLEDFRHTGGAIDFTVLQYDILEKKKLADNFSANRFEGDLKQISVRPRLALILLSYLYNNGAVAQSQLDIFAGQLRGDNSESNILESVKDNLNKLYQKGYVSIHTITLRSDSDIFYTLSAYGAAAFRKDSSRKFIQTRVGTKLYFRPEDEPRVLHANQREEIAFRLRLFNRVQELFFEFLPKRISVNPPRIMPFPYRELFDKQTDKRFLLIPGLLNVVDMRGDCDKIIEILKQHTEISPMMIVSTPEEGGLWANLLSRTDRSVYFLLIKNDKLFIGDGRGEDQFAALFGLQDLESENNGEEMQISVDTQQEQFDSESILEVNSFHSLEEQGEGAVEQSAAIRTDELQLIVDTAMQMFISGRRAEGMLLLHEAAEHSETVSVLRNKISYIVRDPLWSETDVHLLADLPIELPFGSYEQLDDYLQSAIWLRLFFDPDAPNDYRLNNRWRQINSDLSSRVMERYSGIKQLISYFWAFIERYNIGIKYCTSSDVRNQLGINNTLDQNRHQIEEMLKTVFPRNVSTEINHRKVKQMAVDLYGNSGVMTSYLQQAHNTPLSQLRDICQQFTDISLSGEWIGLELNPNEAKLEQYIDRYWAGMNMKASNDKSDMLKGAYRSRMRSWLRDATELLLRCYACRNALNAKRGTTDISPELASKTRNRSKKLMQEALLQLEDTTDNWNEAGHTLLRSTIEHIQQVLDGALGETNRRFYEPLLLSVSVELSEDYKPFRDGEWLQDLRPIHGYRLWERLLEHSNAGQRTWEDTASQALREYNMGAYDLITRRPGEWANEVTVKDTRRRAMQQLDRYNEEFRTEVELAQNYGQMSSNDEMYGYIRLAEAAKKHAEQTHNAGFFKRLLDTCRMSIVQRADIRVEAMRSRLNALKSDILREEEREEQIGDEETLRQWPILKKIEMALEKRNMTVAEDYIQLAASGYKDTSSIQMFDSDLLIQFHNNYQALFNSCNAHKNVDLYRTYDQSVRKMLFSNQNNRNVASAERFIRQWYKLHPDHIKEFMEQLLFHRIRHVDRLDDNEFMVYPAAQDALLSHYPHPFKEFGTDAVQKGLRILTMAGVRTADNLLDEVARHDAGNGSATIVILDYALSLAHRKLLAKSIKLKSFPGIVVVIDRVMALFLAGYSQIERGNAFLMVTLPSSKIQPYIPVGRISPEMFIGRTDELDKIRDLNGPIFVYGGRQLGKTALLQESKNREHNPDKGRYAVFVDLREKDANASLRSISEALVYEKVLKEHCGTWEQLRIALRKRLTSTETPIYKFMLLLDEADAFLSSCEEGGNVPLEILRELKNTFNGQFKFVLAGLRDVIRFDKQRLGGNSVLAHFGHITIRPLKYLDARDLLLRPLHYLGFRIEENGEDIINLILAKTNYYPGLIHFYCEKLIEAISDSYRNGNYNENMNPPYLLDEKYIKTLLGQKEFLIEIENKFRITLKLGSDNLYETLAKVIAYRYYSSNTSPGTSVEDILLICNEFGIDQITSLKKSSVAALLEEMDELNIIRRETRGSDKYVFNRHSFLQMLGSSEFELFEQLYELGVK
ncbi:AAA family ATPase [Paenibacillus paridis]|uniref:AAA family ATPase n=1 Tax=Paenibacillus paridis TaxID=2583376 RepID=UPI001EE4DE16|nr:AAA family ATPase [Paenibacillus paridis]